MIRVFSFVIRAVWIDWYLFEIFISFGFYFASTSKTDTSNGEKTK